MDMLCISDKEILLKVDVDPESKMKYSKILTCCLLLI